MPLDTWLAFTLATLLISLSPGPGALAAMTAGLNHGYAQGQRIAWGLMLGVWTQLAVVGFGLGAVLATSQTAFAVAKWVGAAYLVWLGVQQWRHADQAGGLPQAPAAAADAQTDAGAPKGLLQRGWTVNALNPKGTVFLLAVLPQFIDAQLPLLPQYLVIGLTFGCIECAVMSGYVGLASRIQGLLQSPRHRRHLNRAFGGVFVLAGLGLARFQAR